MSQRIIIITANGKTVVDKTADSVEFTRSDLDTETFTYSLKSGDKTDRIYVPFRGFLVDISRPKQGE